MRAEIGERARSGKPSPRKCGSAAKLDRDVLDERVGHEAARAGVATRAAEMEQPKVGERSRSLELLRAHDASARRELDRRVLAPRAGTRVAARTSSASTLLPSDRPPRRASC
jgi:hypothetical protein